MAEIIFVAHDGTEYRVAAKAEQSVMQAAPHESSMLEEDGSGRAHLRLSCQIAVDEAIDGLIVHMPESQY
jgi:2Fe-2S ferredoxin